MVDACVANGILAVLRPVRRHQVTPLATEDQFRNAYPVGLRRRVERSIRRRSRSPSGCSRHRLSTRWLWAKRVIDEMGDGSGTVMIDGKMQDDATYKQCKVMVGLARMLAEKDADLKAAYQF